MSLDDRQAWWAAYAPVGSHRLIVAAGDERAVGYATSSPYRAHPAFQHTVETSVYLAPDAMGEGIGGRLYDTLLAELTDTEALHIVAAVALPNDASVALHLSRQFTVVGTFTDYAIKRGRRIKFHLVRAPGAYAGRVPIVFVLPVSCLVSLSCRFPSATAGMAGDAPYAFGRLGFGWRVLLLLVGWLAFHLG